MQDFPSAQKDIYMFIIFIRSHFNYYAKMETV